MKRFISVRGMFSAVIISLWIKKKIQYVCLLLLSNAFDVAMMSFIRVVFYINEPLVSS